MQQKSLLHQHYITTINKYKFTSKRYKKYIKRVHILIIIGKNVIKANRDIECIDAVFFTPILAFVNVYAVKLKKNTANGTNNSAENKFHNWGRWWFLKFCSDISLKLLFLNPRIP